MQPAKRTVESTIDKALAFLASKQAEDGGWHSEDYGSMRGGAAITALVLYSVSHQSAERRAAWQKEIEAGLAFAAKGIDEHGCPRNHDNSLDYPTYAAALLASADERLGQKLTREVRERVVTYVLEMQIDGRRGFKEDDPHHGGWELTGDVAMRGVTTGTNISITCYALEALATDKGETANVARRQARRWLDNCRFPMNDGGFFFYPEPSGDSNKAQWTDENHHRPRSYGTATADGLRALYYCGAKPDDEAVRGAAAWLEKHDKLDITPGFEGSDEALAWPKALRFYYYATLAKALPHLNEKTREERRKKLRDHVVTLAHDDGHFENDAHHMRENDPLIATSLALIALADP